MVVNIACIVLMGTLGCGPNPYAIELEVPGFKAPAASGFGEQKPKQVGISNPF